MTPELVAEIQGLSKVYKDFWQRPKVRALDNIDLRLPAGRIFGLLGPNGSGKSTAIKILLGLLRPTRGTVRLFGQEPTRLDVRRRIGYLPEESYLYRFLTPGETLDFYARLFDLPAPERRLRVRQLLDMVGLPSTAERPVGEFSKGMARRVGLAQALINNPQFLILDEPTSGLDPLGCRHVKDLLLRLAQSGKTILLSSHLLADVEDICDEIAILYNGRIRAAGSVRDLLADPDRMRMTLPTLTPQRLKEVLQTLREQFQCDPVVDRPSLDLEQYFLRVVREAEAGSSERTGASSFSDVAPYLLQAKEQNRP